MADRKFRKTTGRSLHIVDGKNTCEQSAHMYFWEQRVTATSYPIRKDMMQVHTNVIN